MSADLKAQLEAVEPSSHSPFEYRPCLVTLTNGQLRDRVYVAEAVGYIAEWGIWPWEDAGKSYQPLEELAEIQDSPTRLPAKIAAKIYDSGESGMGYVVFTLVGPDARHLPCLTGNAVDWVEFPADVSPGDIVDVLPHVRIHPHEDRRETQYLRGSAYAWCLFRAG